MKAQKKKHTVRIIPPHSEYYAYTNDYSEFHTAVKQDTPKQKKDDRISIKDLKKTKRYKTNSKNIRSRQTHLPVYE